LIGNNMRKYIEIDYETQAIASRPVYPPEPVGVAIRINGEGKYYSWGHPTENNCTFEEGKAALKAVLETPGAEFIAHNLMFEAAITEEKMCLKMEWNRWHDTMLLAFLTDAHGELSLKPLSNKLLSLPPDEQDAVRDWLITNGVTKKNQKDWGAYIAMAPGGLVGKYAIGDVVRTGQVFDALYTDEVQEAYRRELELMPHIHEMEKRGVRMDIGRLETDIKAYKEVIANLDASIKSIVGDIDIDSGDELADAIEAKGLAGNGFALTGKGNRSVAKDSIIEAISDPNLLGHILCRRAIATTVRTFLDPWYLLSKDTGRLYVRWNQVRNYFDTGARTGRMSSSPNFQAIPVEWEGLRKTLAKLNYTPNFELPSVRSYVIPDDGNIFIARDYSAQELRLLAHFAGGKLLEILQAEPESDVHMIAAGIAGIDRKVAKCLGFAILYGAGVAKIASSLNISEQEAVNIKKQYLAALPEIKEMQRELTRRGDTGGYLTTIGGRRYKAETPRVIDNKLRTFSYKLTNYLIQGSAADQSKQALIDYAKNTKHGKIVLSVHDEIVIECPTEYQDEEAAILECAMNGSFQDILDYKIISTEARGANFAET
jgi:DNA polymerase I-like protein with 3'-5' exonuclease and polymerase domains